MPKSQLQPESAGLTMDQKKKVASIINNLDKVLFNPENEDNTLIFVKERDKRQKSNLNFFLKRVAHILATSTVETALKQLKEQLPDLLSAFLNLVKENGKTKNRTKYKYQLSEQNVKDAKVDAPKLSFAFTDAMIGEGLLIEKNHLEAKKVIETIIEGVIDNELINRQFISAKDQYHSNQNPVISKGVSVSSLSNQDVITTPSQNIGMSQPVDPRNALVDPLTQVQDRIEANLKLKDALDVRGLYQKIIEDKKKEIKAMADSSEYWDYNKDIGTKLRESGAQIEQLEEQLRLAQKLVDAHASDLGFITPQVQLTEQARDQAHKRNRDQSLSPQNLRQAHKRIQ